MQSINAMIVTSMIVLTGERVQSQSLETTYQQFEDRLEGLSPDFIEENEDLSLITTDLETLAEHRIDLNGSQCSSLVRSGLLTTAQQRALEKHIKTHGDLADFEELQVIPEFDRQTMERIRPFVVAGKPFLSLRRNSVDPASSSSIVLRCRRTLEKSRGYYTKYPDTEPAFDGDPAHLYIRWRQSVGKNLHAGLVAEKDPGEAFLRSQQTRGFDFYSGFVRLETEKWLEQLIIGDMQAGFGQGLTFSTGQASGRSAEVLQVDRSGQGIRASGSSNESGFLRGVGATLRLANTRMSIFLSKSPQDAVFNNSSGEQDILSLNTTGLHRTESELVKKSNSYDCSAGGELAVRLGQLQLGLVAAGQQPVMASRKNVSPVSIFNGKNHITSTAGFHFNWTFRNTAFNGELALDAGRKTAFIINMNLTPDPKLLLAVSFRRYPTGFESSNRSAFGENTKNENETGLYIGGICLLNTKLKFIACIDRYSFPWLKFQVGAPSAGYAHFIRITWQPQKNVEYLIEWKENAADKNQPAELPKPQVPVLRKRTGLRCQLQFMTGDDIRIRCRAETVEISHASRSSNGYLLFQELRFQKAGRPWSFIFRYTIFHTEDYESRIYSYEQDMLGVYSIPANQGRGHRYFTVIHLRQNRRIDWWLKFSRTIYADRKTVGSGLQEIEGPVRTDLGLQCRLRF